jgi:hypothetical protein
MAVRKEIVQATDADVVVKVGTGHYIGASLMAAAANSTLIVYDSVSVAAVANSKIIDVIACTANTSAHSSVQQPVKFVDGLVYIVSGAAARGAIFYKS